MIINFLRKNKKVLVIIVLLFLWGLFGFKKEEEIEPIITEKETVKESETPIKVDIKGAIKNPGVYEMDENSRVEDVIQKSGGLLNTASINTVNLSKKVEDEMVIIIYTEEEIKKFLEEETRSLKQDYTCVCPKVENNACVNNPTTNYQKTESTNSKQVSLNSGAQADFETLPGIGSAKASAIITYRTEHGSFSSIEEIKNVKGIGEAIYEKIKPYLTL